jgi:hypothetical protein
MSPRFLRSSLVRVVAVAGFTVLVAMVAFVGTAGAVFPGAAGRLSVNGTLFDAPGADSSKPILDYPMFDVRFSPDGSQVAGFECPGGSTKAVYVANTDGTDAHQVATAGACSGLGLAGVAWSPDGKEIAFTNSPKMACGSSTCSGSELDAVNVETQTTRVIEPASLSDYYAVPDWSPDPNSHQLVDVMGGADYLRGVYLINSDTGQTERTLYTGSPGAWSARFAPDAGSVVVGLGVPEDGQNATEIRTIPLDGSPGVNFHPATYTPTPTFTPDGLWVTFADCHPGCGIWSRSLPNGSDPGGTYREDVSYPGSSAPSGIALDWEPLVNTPVITSGPSGRVGKDSATFEFSIPSTEQGKYQCRLDGGGWEDGCQSPKTYSGLDDGDHKFEVRFYVEGQNPDDAPIASRSWTVDTTAPDAIIDQSPSGQTTSTDATIVFHSTEPDGATFLCSEDGGPEQDCSSPTRLSGLALGNHTFAVKAVDQVGNKSDAVYANWQVVAGSGGGGGTSGGGGGGGGTSGGGDGGGGGGGPTLGGCNAKEFGKVTAGAVVAVGRFGTCFVRTKKADGSTKWTAAGPIALNGVQINPAGGVTLDQHLNSINAELPAGSTLDFGSFTWTLPVSLDVPISTVGGVAHFLVPNLKKQFKIAGLEVAGKVDFELSTSDGGSSTVTLELELPKIIQGTPGEEGAGAETADEAPPKKNLTLSFKFIASNDKGVRFSFKGTVNDAWLFGKVELSKLSVGLDQGPPLVFEGSATLKFPGVVGGKYTITVGLSDQGDQSFPNVTKLALQASEIQKPLAYGVFLQRFGGAFTGCTGTDGQRGGELSANAGFSVGPKLKIPPLFDGEPISLDGKVTLSLCDPKSIAVSGEGKIVEVSVGKASGKYTWSKGRFDFTGNLDLTIGGWGFAASIDNAFVDMPNHTWNVEATGQLRLPAFVGGALNGDGDVVLSKNGLAACFGKPGHRFGIAKHWKQDLQKFWDSCDVGPYRAGGARAAAAGAGQRVAIPKNDPVALIAVHGSSTAPEVSVAGPGGVRIDSPAGGGGLQTPHGLLVPDAASRTTYVVLLSPTPGTWTVTPDPNTPGTASVQVADGLPQVRVRARVRRAGAKQLLSWALRPIAGQKVTFIEHGSQTDRTLLSTSRASGRLRFTPAGGAGGRRQIIALVTQGGLPRARLVVARFVAPRPPRLRAVAGLRRHGATIRWRREPAATRYSVLLSAPSGAWFATTTRQASVQVPRPMRGVTFTVSITALDAGDNAGPLRTQVLRP